jgi:hypothetical protein
MFESVAVVAETAETLGALRWGVGKGAESVECTDAPTAGFSVVAGEFYATPEERGPGRESEAVYNLILDGFVANDATLAGDQKMRLDPIVVKFRDDPRLCVVLGGFAEAQERDRWVPRSRAVRLLRVT